MRPRQSSLGIKKTGPAARAANNRFNEAEAIKPRNRVLKKRQFKIFNALQ